MKVYIAGISGTGMGPLALMAKAAGLDVCGSDLARGAVYDELVKAGVEVFIGEQDGEFLRQAGADWYVHTSAMGEEHPEVVTARELGMKVTKRDDLTAYLVEELGLRMVAVAGTHGKTTTTSMIAWAGLKLGLPVSYIVGTTLGFAPSGAYKEGDKYFVYEADEYDKNFLKYSPWLAVITCVSYDHPDIYPTDEDYKAAFAEFRGQSERVVEWTPAGVKWRKIKPILVRARDFELAGEARRVDAELAATAIHQMAPEIPAEEIVRVLNEFPGVGRRFERLREGIYTDYAHHPEEIAATVDVALDEARLRGLTGVVAVYQPHQNVRQHEVREGYKEAFKGVEKLYWLPTYLTRENPELPVLSAEELASGVTGVGEVTAAELDDELFAEMMRWRDAGYLVLLMTAGPGDGWLRGRLDI